MALEVQVVSQKVILHQQYSLTKLMDGLFKFIVPYVGSLETFIFLAQAVNKIVESREIAASVPAKEPAQRRQRHGPELGLKCSRHLNILFQ